jgi:uncharacterized membrane protein
MDYSIIQNNRELRACSRGQLQGVWKKMVFTFFIYSLITVLPQFIFWEYSPIHIPLLDLLITIAVLAVSGPFGLGIAGYFLKRIRGEEICTNNIFDGFYRFLSSFLAMLFLCIFVMLWSLLLIVPGLIKAYGYSMVFFIMYDNPGMKPLEALKKSQIMMKGYKWKLFTLHLSFIGWSLLAILTLGIGYFWLIPYIGLSEGNFYENLKKNQENSTANTGSGA